MNENIDDALDAAFTPQRIIQAFLEYKVAKWDRFSGFQDPQIGIPMGTDGITYQGFEKQLERHARNIAARIQTNSYTFHPFREVAVKKKPDKPLTADNTRTLGIASIRDALVQGILYRDVLYEPLEDRFSSLDNPAPVSFAYRKRKSAPLAAQYVYDYANSGYWNVYDADLSKYFDTIPHDKLLAKLAGAIGGDASRTYDLVRRFVSTDRTPYESYRSATRNGIRVSTKVFHWRKPVRANPKRKFGVLQGGVLSGMLANLYLHDFDSWVVQELNRRFDLRYVRYADDFIVMVKDPDLLDNIGRVVAQKLESEDFDLRINYEKTTKVNIPKNGLNYVGFSFDRQHLRIQEDNITRFKDRIIGDIIQAVPASVTDQGSPHATLEWLVFRINSKIQGLRGHEICPWCGFERTAAPRSWMAFFQVTTDIDQLRQLDKWIRQTIYEHMFAEYRLRIDRRDLQSQSTGIGLRSLVNEKFQIRQARTKPCLCDIRSQDQGIWAYARDLFQGKSFRTLARKRSFTVPYVDENGLQVSVGKRQHKIERVVFQQLWNRLVNGEQVIRVDLETSGMRNTSHIVALLAELPGMSVTVSPITLRYKDKAPAQFLSFKEA